MITLFWPAPVFWLGLKFPQQKMTLFGKMNGEKYLDIQNSVKMAGILI